MNHELSNRAKLDTIARVLGNPSLLQMSQILGLQRFESYLDLHFRRREPSEEEQACIDQAYGDVVELQEVFPFPLPALNIVLRRIWKDHDPWLTEEVPKPVWAMEGQSAFAWILQGRLHEVIEQSKETWVV